FGRVGIGTSSPFATLSIQSPAGTTQTAFAIGSSTATSFIVDASGNVGIRISNPSQALTVASSSIIGWDNGAGTADVLLQKEQFSSSGGNLVKGVALQNGTQEQGLNIYSTYTNASNYVRFSINSRNSDGSHFLGIERAGSPGTQNLNIGAGGGILQLSENMGSTRWNIDNSSGFYPEANNGSDIGKSTNLIKTGYFGTSIIDPLLIGGSAVGSSLSLQSTSGVGTTDFIKFLVGNNGATEAMRIVNSGNVGIGTTSPYSKLSIANLATDSTQPLLTIASSTASATTTLFTVLNSGNVGIGTANPSQKLDIVGGRVSVDCGVSSCTAFDSANADAQIRLSFISQSTGWSIEGGGTTVATLRFDADRARFYAGTNDEVFSVLEGGNIGIGDINPDALLEVSASAGASDLFMLSSDDGTDGNRFIVKNSGNVGIGTTSPATTLSVQGNALISGNITSVANITATGTITLPATTATVGIIKSAANTLLHTFGTNNTFVGVSAGNLTMDTDSQRDTAVGTNALASLTTAATSLTAVGYNALTLNTTGDDNTAVGDRALAANVSGSNNTALGSSALTSNTNSSNTAVGFEAMKLNTGGSENTAVGFDSLFNNISGIQNTTIGIYSLLNTTAGNNVAVGRNAGRANTTGSTNTFIGAQDDSTFGLTSANLTNATAIGYNAVVTQSNSLILGSGANVGIGTTSPYAMLSVTGQIVSNNFSATSTTATSTIATGGFTVGTNQFVVQQTSGNVGIGTTNPASGLHILKAAGSGTADVQIGGTARIGPGHDGKLEIQGATTGIVMNNTNATADNKIWDFGPGMLTAGEFDFRALNDSLATANSWLNVKRSGATISSVNFPNGNVGIGTTSPGSKLSVVGNGIFGSGDAADASLITTSPYGSGNSFFSVLDATNDYGILRLGNLTADADADNVGVISFHADAQSGGTFSKEVARISSNLSGTTATKRGGILAFFTRADNANISTERMRIRSDGRILVGTSAAGDTGSATFNISSSTIATGASYYDDNNTELNLLSDSNVVGAGSKIKFRAAGNGNPAALIGLMREAVGGTAGSLTFFTQNSASTMAEKMRIDGSGNVGIGTTSPFGVLAVSGSGMSSLDSSTPQLNIRNQDATNSVGLRFSNKASRDWIVGVQDTGLFQIRDITAAAYRMTIDTDGILTVNTAGPTLQLPNADQQIFLGVVPSDPGWTIPALVIGNSSAGRTLSLTNIGSVDGGLGANIYYDGSWRYKITNPAQQIYYSGADITLRTAPSGTAGDAITWTNGLIVDANAASNPVQAMLDDEISNVAMCYSGAELSADALRGIGDCTSGGADYAELYPVEQGIEYGEIVALGDGSKMIETYASDEKGSASSTLPHLGYVSELKRSTTAYQSNLLGITSNNYSDFTSAGKNLPETINKLPVALNGRVPVKVSTESGPIKIGDRITSSSLAGVGMKATVSGVTVGIALENFDDSTVGSPTSNTAEVGLPDGQTVKTGKILVFINLGYSKLDEGTTQLAANSEQGIATNGWSVDQTTGKVNVNFYGDVNLNGNALLGVGQIVSQNGLWKIDETGRMTMKYIETDHLTVGSTEAPTGITLFDRATKAAYCVFIERGAVSTISGNCDGLPPISDVSPIASFTPTDTASTTPTADSTDTTITTPTTTLTPEGVGAPNASVGADAASTTDTASSTTATASSTPSS
ncbi:MAG: hypothetical protein HYT39_00860, partial [Candidatus Sungbacteria bacterium]|nr:hypothetical protein [Candidatus Sungbacteria bacterium]